MQNIKQHIAYKILTLSLVLAFALPFAVKFAHVFNHHQHEVCNGEYETHLHTADLDCEFYNFHMTVAFTLPEIHYTFLQNTTPSQSIISQYFYISEYQQLHFSLRGPPSIILI